LVGVVYLGIHPGRHERERETEKVRVSERDLGD